MEVKLFGKQIFKYSSNSVGELLTLNAKEVSKELKTIPDFYRNYGELYADLSDFVSFSSGATITSVGKKSKKKEPEKKERTPKGVYELKLLNDPSYKINTNEKYVDEQIVNFKEKLEVIKKSDKDMRNGAHQIASILMRMENRKQYKEFKDFFDQFAYTTTEKLETVIKEHSNLQMDTIEQFVVEFPKEAMSVMKDYNKHCQKLCSKDAVFYIIADKKDFRKTNTRRDPILLAQSPYAHAWQILGAWDDEMLFLDEL